MTANPFDGEPIKLTPEQQQALKCKKRLRAIHDFCGLDHPPAIQGSCDCPRCYPTIEDGFGGGWSKRCPECDQLSMVIVRPGKVQCDSEHCFYFHQLDTWLHHHPCTKEELWKIQNCIGTVLGFDHPLASAAKKLWDASI